MFYQVGDDWTSDDAIRRLVESAPEPDAATLARLVVMLGGARQGSIHNGRLERKPDARPE